MNRIRLRSLYIPALCFSLVLLNTLSSCKHRKHLQQIPPVQPVSSDTTQGRCHLDYKNAKALTKYIHDNEFRYNWISTKADVQVNIDGEDNNLDVRIRARKDSVIWINIQAVGLIDIARLLITRDSVKMAVYVKKQYFKGDYNYINQLLHADLDFDMLQAALFGNSAEFYDEDDKLKPVTDRHNCCYRLSTERKRKLRRLASGQDSLKRSLQTMTLNPDNFKILQNDFIDVSTNRSFHARYDQFAGIDSVYAPHAVNIDIRAEKKVSLKINYVRMELNQPQKFPFNIPSKYDPIPIKKEN